MSQRQYASLSVCVYFHLYRLLYMCAMPSVIDCQEEIRWRRTGQEAQLCFFHRSLQDTGMQVFDETIEITDICSIRRDR